MFYFLTHMHTMNIFAYSGENESRISQRNHHCLDFFLCIGTCIISFDPSFAPASPHAVKLQSVLFALHAMAALKFGAQELDFVRPCDERVLASTCMIR